MKTSERVFAVAAVALILGLPALPPAQAQPYGYPSPYGPPPSQAQPYGYPGPYGPPPYQAPVYPMGSQTSRQQAPTTEEQASVKIFAPKNEGVVSHTESLALDYAVEPGPKGDHVHIYVDGREVAIVRQLKGRYDVGRLAPGRHELAIKVVNQAHVPIDVESSVNVTVR
jgi:hypothetical protein